MNKSGNTEASLQVELHAPLVVVPLDMVSRVRAGASVKLGYEGEKTVRRKDGWFSSLTSCANLAWRYSANEGEHKRKGEATSDAGIILVRSTV